MKIVPDTSVIIDGRISHLINTGEIETGEYNKAEIIVPEAAVAELESQANQGREIGFSGLTELQKLCKLAEEGKISIRFTGTRPTLEQVKLASGGEIDALIRQVAIDNNARFITSDTIQSEVARAKGLDVLYLRPQGENFTPLAIDQFFDEYTIAVYLKERARPVAKKGSIKEQKLVSIRDNPMNEYELRVIAQEVLERARRDPDGFIEMERKGATVVQIGSMRIAISRRPFSDGMEITAVRPIVDIDLDDYKEADQIKELLKGDTRAMLIIGPPGSGKTTLVQGIATYLLNEGNVVKTMEQPRELQIPDEITQYTTLEGSMKNTADLLMLLRPDCVIFDDLRRNDDFEVFSDLRLAGIGMIGVMHALSPGEAICRFIDRVDLSVLHQVIGSIVFVYGGAIQTILTTDLILKCPDGMEGELTFRPVTVVSDRISNEKIYEIFRCENETIIMPASADIYESSEYMTEVDAASDVLPAPVPLHAETFDAVNGVLQTAATAQIAKELHTSEYYESVSTNLIFTENELQNPYKSTIDTFQDEERKDSGRKESGGSEEENTVLQPSTDEVEEEGASWDITERDIQREIGRYTNGQIIVEMRSATKAVVYIDDRDVPAAIGKGGKNIAGIVNRVGVGIDIRPASEMFREDFQKSSVSATGGGSGEGSEASSINANTSGEILINDGLHVRIDKKHLAVISHENIGRIVDVFSGREYLFTATINESGEIILAKNSTIAQEMLKRYNEGEPIRLKAV
ncbi:MAG: PINc/VapC family ATPase [Methanomicrobiales archaeon]|nr:PINc/VapC family ATPase [Methanomicrobiales archaeon]